MMRRLFCAFRGHHAVLVVLGKRMFMRCTSCGHTSHGWEIG